MEFEKKMASAVGAAAILLIAVAPAAFAKGKLQGSTSFTVGCLTSDSALQSAEGITDPTVAPANVTISPADLWPPNHKFKDEAISMSLTDAVSAPVDVSLTVNDITDDQVSEDNPGGSGCGASTAKQGADWIPTDFSTLTNSGSLEAVTDTVSISGVELRSERCAKLGTRTYEVSVTCCDATNSVCDSTPEVLDVTVKKSQGHHGKL